MVREFWTFRVSLTLLTLMNFILLIITASSRIEQITGVGIPAWLWAVIIPGGLLGAWFCGWLMLHVLKVPQEEDRIAGSHSPLWRGLHADLQEIKKLLKEKEEKK